VSSWEKRKVVTKEKGKKKGEYYVDKAESLAIHAADWDKANLQKGRKKRGKGGSALEAPISLVQMHIGEEPPAQTYGKRGRVLESPREKKGKRMEKTLLTDPGATRHGLTSPPPKKRFPLRKEKNNPRTVPSKRNKRGGLATSTGTAPPSIGKNGELLFQLQKRGPAAPALLVALPEGGRKGRVEQGGPSILPRLLPQGRCRKACDNLDP